MAFDNNRNKHFLTFRLIGDVPPFRCNTLYINSPVTFNLIEMMVQVGLGRQICGSGPSNCSSQGASLGL